jgi:hypothetical protein
LADKVASFPESSYGAKTVTLVLGDGTTIEHVKLAWGPYVIKAMGAENESRLSEVNPSDVVDVLSEA